MKKYILISLIQLIILQTAFSQLYWTEGEKGKIRSRHPDGGRITTIVSRLAYPSGVTVDTINGKIYWTDRGNFGERRGPNIIQKANLDGSDIEDVITTGLKDAFGLTVDPVGKKLYWVDAVTNKVECSDLNGGDRKVLVDKDLGAPEGIALDLVNKKLYWTTVTSGDIQCSNLDGSDVSTLYSNVGDLEGLALDLKSGDIYVADLGGSILRAKIDGSGIITLISGLSRPIAVALDLSKKKLYWAEERGGMLKRSDLDGLNVKILKKVKLPKGIALVLE